jgi:TRAP-type C4-dicarboxylate transport system permease small subunit
MGVQRPGVVERLSIFCNRWAEYLLLLLGLSMSSTVILQVFFRYILNDSLFWSEELARFFLVWLTFVGATVAYRRNMHPGVDAVFKRLDRPQRQKLKGVVDLLCLVFFAILIWYGTHFAYFIRAQTTPALGLPKWLVFSIIPLSGVLFSLHAIAFISTSRTVPADGEDT